MTATISVLALLAVWAILANVERLPWPPQRVGTLQDAQYWQTVLSDSAAYLAAHSTIDAEIRRNVARTIAIAERRLAR